jgi:hypothetical protein
MPLGLQVGQPEARSRADSTAQPEEVLGTNRIARRKLMDSWATKNNESWFGQGMNVMADEQTVV